MKKKKTTTKKTATGKTRAKTRTTKKIKAGAPKKRLVEAPPDMCFWVHNGPVIKNLKELNGALKKMTDGQFTYHTERDGNDFAKWVECVLGQKTCAKKIAAARTKTGTIRVISVYIK